MAFDQPIRSERRKVTDRRLNSPHNFSAVDWVAMAILVVGGINWGLVGLMNIDLVKILFGEMTAVARSIYTIVGLAGLYVIYMMVRLSNGSNR